MKNPTPMQLVLPYFWIAVASVIYAVGFCWCFEANQIGFGGLTGVAQIINNFFPQAPIGTVVIVLNIPLFFFGWRLLGGKLLVTSLFAMAASSLCIDTLSLIYSFEAMDPLLACIFGGLLVGLALGLVLMQGATTGGTDLLARLLKLRIQWLPMGKILLAIDLVVVLAVAVAFQNLFSALYGLIAIYITSLVIDQVLYGMDNAKVAYIISDHHGEIAKAILAEVDRGVTILHGEGAYSGAEKKVLMVAFKHRQIVTVKRTVKEIDPAAFLVVCEAHEVLGDGFRVYEEHDI